MRRSDHSFGGVLPAASVCLIVGYLETSETRRPRFELGCYMTGMWKAEQRKCAKIHKVLHNHSGQLGYDVTCRWSGEKLPIKEMHVLCQYSGSIRSTYSPRNAYGWPATLSDIKTRQEQYL